MTNKTLEERCFESAIFLVNNGFFKQTEEMDIFDYTKLLINLEEERAAKNVLTDQSIDYNDEIICIEDVGMKPTVDISVTGDNLFFCNDILTKNSMGTGHTADLIIAIINNEELERLGQYLLKQIKNRIGDATVNKRCYVGVDRSKMRIFDIGDAGGSANPSAPPIINEPEDEAPVVDPYAAEFKDQIERFKNFNF